MRNKFIQNFIEPLDKKEIENKWWQYGFLIVILVLLSHDIYRVQTRDNPSYDIFIVTIMLLLNHLAYQFKFGAKGTIFIRALAWVWIILGVSYTFLYK